MRIVRDNCEIGLHNGWFVVQNRPKNPPLLFDREEAEKETFCRHPWTEIPAKQRGIAALKKFLANTLSTRIRKAFPEVQRRIKELLAKERENLENFGEEREGWNERQQYLVRVLKRYQELARESLSNPERLPSSSMKLRGMTRTAMDDFANKMKLEGHLHGFADVPTDRDPAAPCKLYEEIRTQINENRGEELSGMTNPTVMKPLFALQTSKWEGIGQSYLDEVVKMSKTVALLILDCVFSELAVPEHAQSELLRTINDFEAQAWSNASLKLREICKRNSLFPLVTTDDNFAYKVRVAQEDRFIAAVDRYKEHNPPASFFPAYVDKEESKLLPEMARISAGWVILDRDRLIRLFEEVHPRAMRNTEDEIHDLLKAYYEVTINFHHGFLSPSPRIFSQYKDFFQYLWLMLYFRLHSKPSKRTSSA